MPGYRPYQHDARSYKGLRGSPRNADFAFEATHPCVRTNPVTGWKALWVGGGHCAFINNVTAEENADLMGIVDRLITKNHDIQARYRWENENDIGESFLRSDAAMCFSVTKPRDSHLGQSLRPAYPNARPAREETWLSCSYCRRDALFGSK